MIIHKPVIAISHGEVSVSARIEFETVGTDTPEKLWFKFPEKYARWISPRGDGFLLALLLIGMYYQEDIEVLGEISPLLAYNLPVITRLYHQAVPTLFKPIETKLALINPLESGEDDHRAVGMAFSGGVDSTYTLWSHLPKNQAIESARITHGLFIHGVDVLLQQTGHYERTLDLFNSLYQRLGLELIPASTNIYSFYEFRVDWNFAYAPPIIGVAMQLERLFNRFYLSSGGLRGRPRSPISWTHHFFSTENLRTILYSPEVDRNEKIEAIREWEEIWGTLRVCSTLVKPDDRINCCRCGRCINMMAHLEILGDLGNFISFHETFRSYFLFKWLWRSFEPHIFSENILKMSWQHKRWDFWIVMLLMYIPGSIRTWFYRFKSKHIGRIPPDLKYAIKSRIFPRNL